MPLVYLFLICLTLAVNPALLVLGLVIWLLSVPISRQRKLGNAGINAAFGGASMVDDTVTKGRRRL